MDAELVAAGGTDDADMDIDMSDNGDVVTGPGNLLEETTFESDTPEQLPLAARLLV